jgi:peptidoglycan glycosyltransferase
LTLVTLILTATLGARLEERLQQQIARVDEYNNFESTFFYDRNGTVLYEAFTEGRRENVRYEDFPQDLINATIAIEDDSFWNNPGFEVQATLRAFLQYVGLAQGSSGGSTITQQVVRNVLFEPEYRAERSVQRKVEEILLAFLLRQRKSPQEVLELYLNESYYGNLAYGAQAAARTFFNKDVQNLTLPEAALLAGLPQAPAILDPFNEDPTIQEAVVARWTEVLDRMLEDSTRGTSARAPLHGLCTAAT